MSFHCCKEMESLGADFEGHNSAGSKKKMHHVNGPHVIKDFTHTSLKKKGTE